ASGLRAGMQAVRRPRPTAGRQGVVRPVHVPAARQAGVGGALLPRRGEAMSEEKTPLGLLLSDDLIFTSRVTATARALGLTVRAAKSVEALEALARQQTPSGVLIDLATPGLDVPDLIARLRAAGPTVRRAGADGAPGDAAAPRRVGAPRARRAAAARARG